jgi:S-adenosylmethionine:tRNA ribosyltransferase-isomerase
MKVAELTIDEYTYDLPDERIAGFPLENRDASKLLLYKGDQIGHTTFRNVAEHIPPGSLMIWNDTRVIQARIMFKKPSGAEIEILLLEPEDPAGYASAFAATGECSWFVLVGNLKKWKQGLISARSNKAGSGFTLNAERIGSKGDETIVRFTWKPANLAFIEIIDRTGLTPLPPYIKRHAISEDRDWYQTVYARNDGSVAAPTAGLHFTPEVIGSLKRKNISILPVTLHVGAGTFLPIKTRMVVDHRMHSELVIVPKDLILRLMDRMDSDITSIGTTTLRSLESLYWLGIKILRYPEVASDRLFVDQWIPYETKQLPDTVAALKSILRYMSGNGLEEIRFYTNLIIVPGFQFRIVNRLITNFHQPGSTLLLLVAAFTGEKWKDIYQYALANDFRFLSYGDGSLLER